MIDRFIPICRGITGHKNVTLWWLLLLSLLLLLLSVLFLCRILKGPFPSFDYFVNLVATIMFWHQRVNCDGAGNNAPFLREDENGRFNNGDNEHEPRHIDRRTIMFADLLSS